MAYWKFTCTWDTEWECMIRRLFGNHEKTTADGAQLDVEQNDILFLHRMMTKDSNKQGYLLCPFVGASSFPENINSDAWSHLGPINWLEGSDPPLEINQYAQKYTEVQGIYLKGQVKNECNTIIDYP